MIPTRDGVFAGIQGAVAAGGADVIEPVVSSAAVAADAVTFFLSSRSTASAMRASFNAGSICARSM